MTLYTPLRSAYWFVARPPERRIRRALAESQRWDRATLGAHRDARVRELVAHCYENVPYYRRVMDERALHPRDFTGVSDLQKLPLLTKADVRANVRDLLARNIPPTQVSWSRTGGTTGEPIRAAKDRECSAWEGMSYERGVDWGGLALGVPRVILFGGSLGIDRPRWNWRLRQLARPDVVLPAFELRSDTAARFFDVIRRSRARHIIGYASSIYRLAILAEESARDISFDAAFPTAELLLPEWADAIRQRFHCEVLPFYGCGEVNSLGYTPRGDDTYVIPEEHCVVEVAPDRDGISTGIGDGQFVITSLVNRAMPLLRYVNGDAGRIGPPSGRFPFGRITRLDGRYNSLLMTDSGDLISGVLGTHVFRHLTAAVETYRIIQRDPLEVVIRVVPRREAFATEEENLVRSLFQKYLGARMRVTVERVPAIPPMPSGKSMFVINELLS